MRQTKTPPDNRVASGARNRLVQVRQWLLVAVCIVFLAPVASAQNAGNGAPASDAAAGKGAQASATQASATQGSAVEQLKAFVAGTQAASGRFEQLAGNDGSGEVSRGHFVFARPGRFRWEVVEPYPQVLVADGTDVYFHDPDLNQVTVRSMTGALGATPAAILFGTGDLDENFELSALPAQDGVQWLQATPRESDAGFEQIRLGFAGGLPVAMEVLDAFNRTTRFTFADFQRNPAVAAATFQFEIPKGADVVRQ